MSFWRIFIIVLGVALTVCAADVLWEVLARSASTGEILVQPALRQRPRLPPAPYPWHSAWTIILGWALVTAAGVALALAGALRSGRAVLFVPALLLLGFICIAGATVLSNLAGAITYLAVVVAGVAAMAGFAVLSERLELWKAERRFRAGK